MMTILAGQNSSTPHRTRSRIIVTTIASTVLCLTITPPVLATHISSTARQLVLTPKILVIGIDGARWDRLQKASTPNIDKLVKNGLFDKSRTSRRARSLSGPGWSSIATGVWPAKHKVTNNDLRGNKFKKYPDFLTRLEKKKPHLSTFSMTAWGPLGRSVSGGPLLSNKIDKKYAADVKEYKKVRAEDVKIAAKASAMLRGKDPDAGFVVFGEVDKAGHVNGTGAKYLAAIERADAYVGRLVSAIRSRPSYVTERWQILIATDHGHRDGGGHGGQSAKETQTWIVAQGAGIPAGETRRSTRMVDVAVTALTHLGVSSSGLDGRSLTSSAG